ncbi:hypothetical protein ACHQM5_029282 [Ranunculus cassubicifolius]
MAEDDSTFLEIFCKSSGKIRRFAKGTDSQFALQLINDRLVNDNVALPASYIQAVKDGEEPIFFGPKSILIDYGDGWKLETVLSKVIEKENVLTPRLVRDKGGENDKGGGLALEQVRMDGGHEKQNGIESVMAQFHNDEDESGSENENGVGNDDDMEIIINQFRTDEELGKETSVEPIWKQLSTDDGFEHENVLEPTLEQAAADKGVRKRSARKSTLKKTPDHSVYPSLPSPEPLSLIVSNYGSDEEEREWAASDPNGDYPDLTEAFTTQTDFGGKDEIVEWCKKVGSENGTVIIIGRSDCEKSGRRPRVFLRCERSGTVKARRRVQTEERVIQKRQRNTPTKKCDCPFMIKATLLNNGKWEVKVECGTHNHPLLESIDGHPTYARLTEEEAKLVTQLSIAGFKPSQMLDALKRRDPNNVSTLPTIYNFRAKRGLTKTTRKPWEMVPSP